MEEVTACAESFEDAEVIAIKLNDSNKVFHVQKAVLISVSPYFAKALDGALKEATERTLKLPGYNESTLQLFMYWLCRRKLPEFSCKNDFDSAEDVLRQMNTIQTRLVCLWCFADQYLIPELQNNAMKSLLDFFKDYKVIPEAVVLAFEISSSSLLICQAMADQLAEDWLQDKMLRGNRFDEAKMNKWGATPGLMKALMDRVFDPNEDREPTSASANFEFGVKDYFVKIYSA